MGSGKGTRSGNSRFLFWDIPCTKKERNLRPVVDLSLLNRYIKKQPFKMETIKSVRHSIVNNDWAVSIDLPSRSDTSSIKKVSLICPRRSDIPIHSLTLWNVPKSVDFYQIDGRCSIESTSTCHLSCSVPRQLADKKFNLQSITVSDKILPSSSSDSKPKKPKLIPAQNFTFIGMEFLTQQNLVRIPAERARTLRSTIKTILSCNQVSVRTFLSLLGKFNAAADFTYDPCKCVSCLSGDLTFCPSIIKSRSAA